jgi:hypothetical protein
MRTTFLVAQRLAVSPFEVMAQEIDAVIMVVNFLLDSASESKQQEGLSEKERDRDFWSAL